VIPKLWLAKIVQSSLRNQKKYLLFTAWLNSEHVSSVIDNKVLEWSVVGPDFILVECQIWMIIITFLSCSDPTTNILFITTESLNHILYGIYFWIFVRKVSLISFCITYSYMTATEKTTTLLSDLIRHEKTLVINQSHIKYGSLCFYATLIFLFFRIVL
jgi:hypothetical protein